MTAPLFRHENKLIDVNDFLDNLHEEQGLSDEEELIQLDLFDSLGG